MLCDYTSERRDGKKEERNARWINRKFVDAARARARIPSLNYSRGETSLEKGENSHEALVKIPPLGVTRANVPLKLGEGGGTASTIKL